MAASRSILLGLAVAVRPACAADSFVQFAVEGSWQMEDERVPMVGKASAMYDKDDEDGSDVEAPTVQFQLGHDPTA